MNKLFSVALALVVATCPCYAFSEELVVHGPLITTLKKGSQAPFAGTLLNNKAVAELIVEKETAGESLKLEIDHALEIQKIKHQFELDEVRLQLKYFKLNSQEIEAIREGQIKFLSEQLEKRSDPHIEYWFVGGVVVGIVTSLLVFWAPPKIK